MSPHLLPDHSMHLRDNTAKCVSDMLSLFQAAPHVQSKWTNGASLAHRLMGHHSAFTSWQCNILQSPGNDQDAQSCRSVKVLCRTEHSLTYDKLGAPERSSQDTGISSIAYACDIAHLKRKVQQQYVIFVLNKAKEIAHHTEGPQTCHCTLARPRRASSLHAD